MSKKTAGIVASIVGIVIFGLSLLADRLGIGVAGFGSVQIVGTILGAIVIALGLFLTLKKSSPTSEPLPSQEQADHPDAPISESDSS